MTANRSTHATAKRWRSQTLALALTVALLSPPLPSQQTTGYTFHAETDLVLVNVTVRDKSGNFVRDLAGKCAAGEPGFHLGPRSFTEDLACIQCSSRPGL